MCGIIGITGHAPVTNRLVEGLKRLEYRGYDSAGIAVIDAADGASLSVRRCVGKVQKLEHLLTTHPAEGHVGIGHTRWGTHGAATEANAHPHSNGNIAIVHNGIIENFAELKDELQGDGVIFSSETDTEVILHVLAREYQKNVSDQNSALEAVFRTLDQLQGSFALAILFREHPEALIGARRGSPLAVGYGQGEMYLGSDALAMAGLSERIAYLEDHDCVVLTPHDATFYDATRQVVSRATLSVAVDDILVSKMGYPHFMLKEIFEYPSTVQATLAALVSPDRSLEPLQTILSNGFKKQDQHGAQALSIIACGTSYYAAMVAKYWIEQFAKIPVMVDIASEFRYRHPPLHSGALCVFISQSGETADTLAALEIAKAKGAVCIALVNVPSSSLARQADAVLLTQAGREIGVASTKAFAGQLTALACLAIALGRNSGHLDAQAAAGYLGELSQLPHLLQETLSNQDHIAHIARQLIDARSIMYLGRGTMFPIALEGALKLKELSYIHAEGFPAGEMKHGSIALIDASVPVVVLAPSQDRTLFEKTLSNTHEALVRGARVVLITDPEGAKAISTQAMPTLTSNVITVPASSSFIAPMVMAAALQLLAYHAAVLLGRDVDQPRNLAKSVTVE